MIEKLCDNLNILMAKQRINANELARKTGLPASTIKKIRNRDNPNPTLTTLIPIARFFSVTVSQLLGEEGLPNQFHGDEARSLQVIPIIAWEDALAWPQTLTQPRATMTIEHAYSQNAFALIVDDDDGKHMLKNTVLIIDPATEAMHKDFVIAHKTGQQKPSLKQMLFDEDNKYLKHVTHDYQMTALTPEHRILGVLMEYRHQTRKL